MQNKTFNLVRIAFLLYMIAVYLFTTQYHFLLLNCTLAYIPLELSFWLNQHKPKSNLAFFAIFLAWLLFWPNLPYLLTDLIHLDLLNITVITTGQYQNFPNYWKDFCFLVLGALGLTIIGFKSLGRLTEVIRQRFLLSKNTMILFLFAVFVLSSTGIYIGRFLRLHSVDLIINFIPSLKLIITMVNHQFMKFILAFTLLQSLLYLIICHLDLNKDFNIKVIEK